MSRREDGPDALTGDSHGGALDELEVTDVSVGETAVVLTVELPGGNEFTDTYVVPPVWGSNCRLKRLLDAAGLDRDSVADLEGRTVPCRRRTDGDGLSFEVDLAELARGSGSRSR